MMHVKWTVPVFCVLISFFQHTRSVSKSMAPPRAEMLNTLDIIDCETNRLNRESIKLAAEIKAKTAQYNAKATRLQELADMKREWQAKLFQYDGLLPTQTENQTTTHAEITEHPTNQPTKQPSAKPTEFPTNSPTKHPTKQPTNAPTTPPTNSPTKPPTNTPTTPPTANPTLHPTLPPTNQPTVHPTLKPTVHPTAFPTKQPTKHPTKQPTKEPTNKPTKHPTTANPTNKPTKHPTTAKPTKNPTTSKPTNHPTSQWWSNATSSKPKPDEQTLRKERNDRDKLLLSQLNTPKEDTITIYKLNAFPPQFAASVQLSQLHGPNPPYLIIKQTPSVYETAMDNILELVRKYILTRKPVTYGILSRFFEDWAKNMVKDRATNIIVMDTMREVLESLSDDAVSKSTALAHFFDPLHYEAPRRCKETSMILVGFVVDVFRKLTTLVAQEIKDELNGDTHHIPAQFMFFLTASIEKSVYHQVTTILNLDNSNYTQTSCEKFLQDARQLMDMRSELLALEKLYDWRFVQKRHGPVVYLTIDSHSFIPLAVKMGYAQSSIQLFDVLNGKVKPKQRYKLNQMLNYSEPWWEDLMNASCVSIKEKKKKVCYNDTISIFTINDVSENAAIFEKELILDNNFNDLVIVTARDCPEGIGENKTVKTYYDTFDAMSELLMRFISRMEDQTLLTAWREILGGAIFLMSRVNGSVFDGIYRRVMAKYVLENLEEKVLMERKDVMRCIQVHYDVAKLSGWNRPLKLIQNAEHFSIILDFWLESFVTVLKLQLNDCKKNVLGYEDDITMNLTNIYTEMVNLERKVQNIIRYAKDLLGKQSVIIDQIQFSFHDACRVVNNHCQDVVAIQKSIKIMHAVYQWKKLNKRSVAKITIVVMERAAELVPLLHDLGYEDESIHGYTVRYNTSQPKGTNPQTPKFKRVACKLK
eukprot:182402_1